MRYLLSLVSLIVCNTVQAQDTCFMQLKDKWIIAERMPLDYVTMNDVRYSEVHIITAKNKEGKDGKLLVTASVNETIIASNDHCSLMERKGTQLLILKTFYSGDNGKSFTTMTDIRKKLAAKFNPELNFAYPVLKGNCLEVAFTLRRDPGKRDYYTSCDGGKTFKKKTIK
jgi:hypothetical protein